MEGDDARSLHDYTVQEDGRRPSAGYLGARPCTLQSSSETRRKVSRPLIVRFHKYAQKERVLLWARKSRDVSYQGHPIRIFEDFSATLAKKRAAFNKVKSQLYKEGNTFRLTRPSPPECYY
ncbi:hypothetical protein KUCAC02_034029 [Chaenocephalus aceratus]|nr:hypothetical protein KUCAC02_034029 [Chaenocephalus aceratus]